jgi:hypothetical protein
MVAGDESEGEKVSEVMVDGPELGPGLTMVRQPGVGGYRLADVSSQLHMEHPGPLGHAPELSLLPPTTSPS